MKQKKNTDTSETTARFKPDPEKQIKRKELQLTLHLEFDDQGRLVAMKGKCSAKDLREKGLIKASMEARV